MPVQWVRRTDPHGIKQITVGPPHGIKQITMFIRENVECLDSSFTTTTTIKYSTVDCASVMCDCYTRACDLCLGLASCAVTTPGLDSKQLLGRQRSTGITRFEGLKRSSSPTQNSPCDWSVCRRVFVEQPFCRASPAKD
ncbi:hypothetical protein J6590_088023 [Homalodisca vitripennis]|nr:hypothetical protein J6590_088023 [Homalodisca vitripennis]